MLLSPLLRYLDIFEILNRHYFAPRATTQEDLYSCFTGGWYNLAERFTVRLGDTYTSYFLRTISQCVSFVCFYFRILLRFFSWLSSILLSCRWYISFAPWYSLFNTGWTSFYCWWVCLSVLFLSMTFSLGWSCEYWYPSTFVFTAFLAEGTACWTRNRNIQSNVFYHSCSCFRSNIIGICIFS